MKNEKMNTLLAKVEHSCQVFKRNISQYMGYFKNEQGQFKGICKTYAPREGYPEDASKSGVRQVVTTVAEQFDWLKKTSMGPYLKELFAVEATNSKGANTVPLIVGNLNLGNLTALELMRLKSVLTDPNFEEMLNRIPVRSDAVLWEKTKNENYAGREIYETPLLSGVTRTTEKEEVILKDPNLQPDHLPSNYVARTTVKNKLVETGDYTMQEFSGEWSQVQKANILKHRSELLAAVIAALKDVNDIEASDSNLNVDAMMEYLFQH